MGKRGDKTMNDTENRGEKAVELHCKLYPFNTLGSYKYVVVCSFYKGKKLLSRRKDRNTWETQGGHIECGETPIEAAKRELYEESGVVEATLYPVCDYRGWTQYGEANGTTFFAIVEKLGDLPESEMAEAKCFDELPDELTYPHVTPALFMESQIAVRNRNK